MEFSASPNKSAGVEAEYDELDEFNSDDDEDPNVFKIREPLEQACGVTYTTKQLHELIHEGVVDLNPPYQRAVVWPESKQIGLIDSIFRNYWVPPIVFTVSEDEDGIETRICVDGKQRLTSIQKFFDGQIPHKDPVTKKSWWYTTPPRYKATRSEVPETFKQTFCEKKITCVEYHNLTPGAERDIFQRVQLGMSLTAAEKLQAISSPWAEWISELEARHVGVEGGLTNVLEWDTKRGRDFQNIAFMVCCCDGLPDAEHIPTAPKIEKWMCRVDRPTEKFKSEIEDVLREFWNIAANPTLNAPFKKIGKRIAPVEFVFVGVLLFVMRKRPIEQKADAIFRLRKTIRSEFKDIRNNSTVAKSMWNFINTVDMNTTSALFNGHGERSKGKKKRRAESDEEEEDEYRPQPIKTLGKNPSTRSKRPKAR